MEIQLGSIIYEEGYARVEETLWSAERFDKGREAAEDRRESRT